MNNEVKTLKAGGSLYLEGLNLKDCVEALSACNETSRRQVENHLTAVFSENAQPQDSPLAQAYPDLLASWKAADNEKAIQWLTHLHQTGKIKKFPEGVAPQTTENGLWRLSEDSPAKPGLNQGETFNVEFGENEYYL